MKNGFIVIRKVETIAHRAHTHTRIQPHLPHSTTYTMQIKYDISIDDFPVLGGAFTGHSIEILRELLYKDDAIARMMAFIDQKRSEKPDCTLLAVVHEQEEIDEDGKVHIIPEQVFTTNDEIMEWANSNNTIWIKVCFQPADGEDRRFEREIFITPVL